MALTLLTTAATAAGMTARAAVMVAAVGKVIVISCAQPKLGGGWLVGGAVAVAVSATSVAGGVTLDLRTRRNDRENLDGLSLQQPDFGAGRRPDVMGSQPRWHCHRSRKL